MAYEKNQLIRSTDNTVDVYFVYGEDGKRSHKYTWNTETLYFNNFWSYYKDGTTSFAGGKVSKHIFLGETRLATTINDYAYLSNGKYSTEWNHIYYYHSDHLGSAQLVTDYRGDEYERLEYTPYGETWVNVKIQEKEELTPMSFRFSAKELDKETSFYYYGARYLDPKYSRWISTDPALGEYIPAAGKANAKDMANLPGMGGIFNHINADLYHYAGNNPVRYIDPDGRIDYIYSLDEEGNKTIREENDWGKWEGFHRDRYYVETPDGERYRANSLETVIKNDWKKIDTDFLNGKFKKLIDEANEKPTGLIRIFNESGDGELDFKLQLDEDTLYYNGDVLYNPNEAGNFLWTYFLESHGFHFLHSILAQGGSLKGKDRFDEWHDTKARWSGFAYYWKNRIKKR